MQPHWDKMSAEEKASYEAESKAQVVKKRFVKCGTGEVASVHGFVDPDYSNFVRQKRKAVPARFCGALICGNCARRVCGNPSCHLVSCLSSGGCYGATM